MEPRRWRGEPRPARPLALALAAFLAAVVFAGAVAARKQPKPSKTPSEVLATQVNTLVRRLYGLYLDQFEPVMSQIQKQVVDHLDEWIADRQPDFVEVREQMDSIFSRVRYPFEAESAVLQTPWKGGSMILAGYTVGWSDTERVSTVALYESQNGHTRRVALINFLPRADLHYDLVPPGPAGNLRFIIWGNVMGMDHARLAAVLYDFDGKDLKPLWKNQDIYDGQLQVLGGKVIIKYLDRTEYVQAVQQNALPPRHEATYMATPDGLKLESLQDIPF